MNKVMLALAWTASSIALQAQEKQTAKRPNIILIMADDLGWGDVGFNGNKEIKTPNLDMLAARGTILTRFYSAGSVCSPTRASCLTGRNPNRIGIFNANSGHLKPEEITLPELLQAGGYHTGHFGKWHLGTLTTAIKDANRGMPRDYTHYATPAGNGYNEYFVTESKVPTYDPYLKPNTFDKAKGESLRYGWAAMEGAENDNRKAQFYGTHYWKGQEDVELRNVGGDDSRVVMDRVLPFVERSISANRPFFSVVWFHTPHLPLVTSKKYRDVYSNLPYQKQLLYGAITAMDEQIGRLWDLLQARGEADRTMIWFCSDNGPENNTPGSPGPFRERKRSLHEGGVRVPAFVLWPEGIAAGQSNDIPMVTSDYLPTILAYLDLTYPDANRPIDGMNLSDILSGAQQQRGQAIGFRYGSHQSWVTDQYKLISKDNGKTFELYDLIEDKEETANLASGKKKVAASMQAALNAWLASCRRSAAGQDY